MGVKRRKLGRWGREGRRKGEKKGVGRMGKGREGKWEGEGVGGNALGSVLSFYPQI